MRQPAIRALTMLGSDPAHFHHFQITRWLDPAMGEFHSKTNGAVKLGTATEYIWFDMPKSPNVDVEVHQRVCMSTQR